MSNAMHPRATADRVPTIAEKLVEWESERDLPLTQRSAVYVSTPITTGPTFIDWLRRVGRDLEKGSKEYLTALRAEVILPNTQRAARFLELLRWQHMGMIIDPTSLEVPGWDQSTYHEFWRKVLERHARRVIFLNGWELSHGCTLEFETAQCLDLDCVDETLKPLSRDQGLQLIRSAAKQVRALGIDTSALEAGCQRLQQVLPGPVSSLQRQLYKDEVLDHLANTANVAQFVSFTPGNEPKQRFCRIRGFAPNHCFASVRDAVQALLQNSPEGMVNVRSFDPVRPEGNPFIRRLSKLEEVLTNLRRLGSELGLYTIVNETIDEHDGGISGVSYRGVIEFAPDANPRCVDDDEIETAVFPFEIGMGVLQNVYNFEPDLRGREGARVEFSIHPMPRGWMQNRTIIWQLEQRPTASLKVDIRWPNEFSRFLGDKAFGLVVASAAGLPVPRTMVFGRRLFPFTFGQSTGTGRVWTRTCPAVKTPGYYPSARGWKDPYSVLEDVHVLDPNWQVPVWATATPPSPLVSVIVQEAVRAEYSGRMRPKGTKDVEIHGVRGEGDDFMLGDAAAIDIPAYVKRAVRSTYDRARKIFGPVEIEWVFDGVTAWIVQTNVQKRLPQEATFDNSIEWIDFLYTKGQIEDFRHKVIALQESNTRHLSKKGIRVFGNVSPLSHWGEIAEVHGVPVQFVPIHRGDLDQTPITP